MKAKYQTVTIADITLSASAQKSISYMQGDVNRIICENLHKVSLLLCQNSCVSTAPENLELIHSVLSSRDLIHKIGIKDDDDE